jgi:5'-nucleotidase
MMKTIQIITKYHDIAFASLFSLKALGNHDFDDGPANTARFLKNINCSVVISNLEARNEPTWSRHPRPLFVKSKVLEIGGEKIGIVGYTLQSTSRLGSHFKVTCCSIP